LAPFSTSVELNLGLILRVEERSSLLMVKGEALAATERLVCPSTAPLPAPALLTSARDSEDR